MTNKKTKQAGTKASTSEKEFSEQVDKKDTPRRRLLEELFNDFNRNRWDIYKINFVRGIFFGLGSVIGGTIVVAFIVWALSGLAQNIDNQSLSDFFDALSRSLRPAK